MTLTEAPPQAVSPTTIITKSNQSAGARAEREFYILLALSHRTAGSYKDLIDQLPFTPSTSDSVAKDVRSLVANRLVTLLKSPVTDGRPKSWDTVTHISLTSLGQVRLLNVPAHVKANYDRHVVDPNFRVEQPIDRTRGRRKADPTAPTTASILAALNSLKVQVEKFVAAETAETKRLKAENKDLRAYKKKVQAVFSTGD